MRHDIGLDSIKMMSEEEFMQYVQILQAFDEIEAEELAKQQQGH